MKTKTAISLSLPALLLVLASAAQAADRTWTGGGADNNWATTANWSPTPAPATNDNVIFAGATRQVNTNNISSLTNGVITYNPSSGAFTNYGNAITLTKGLTNSAGNNALYLGLTLTAAEGFANNAAGTTLLLGSTINNNGYALTLAGAGNFAQFTNVNVISGTGAVIKAGSGLLTINAANTFTGGLTINGGNVLGLGNQSQNRLPNASAVTVNSGGAMIIGDVNVMPLNANAINYTVNAGGLLLFTNYFGASGFHSHVGSITLNGGSVVGASTGVAPYANENFNLQAGVTVGGTTPSSITVDYAMELVSGTHTWNAADATANPSVDLTMNGNLIGAGSLVKAGAGTLLFNGNESYTGGTTINGGTLVLSPTASLASPLITLASNAVFDVSALNSGAFQMTAGQTLAGNGRIVGTVWDNTSTAMIPGGFQSAGTLIFSNGLTLNGSTLWFDLANTTTPGGGTNDLLIVGNLTLGGQATIAISPLNGSLLPGGVYTLIKYGAIVGSEANLTLLSSHVGMVLTNDTAQNSINLIVTGTGTGESLVWQGDGSANGWDFGNVYNLVWTNAPFSYAYFGQGDVVTFNDTGLNTPAVNLLTNVAPASVTVNAALDYVFMATNGAGKITGGGTLTKLGTGTLTISNRNDYIGGTAVNNGTMALAQGGSVGSLAGPMTINSGGTVLSLVNDSFGYSAATRVNALTVNGGTLVHTPANNLTLWGINLSMNGGAISATNNGGGRLDIGYPGDISMPPSTFTTLPNASSAVVGGAILNLRQAILTNTVADGPAAEDLLITASLNSSAGANVWVKQGPGTLALRGNTDNVSLGVRVDQGAVIFGKDSSSAVHAVGGTPGLNLQGGTLQLAGTGDDQIYIGSSVVADSGTFDFNGRNEGFNSLSGSNAVVVNSAASAASTMTVGQNNGSGTFGGSIQDGAGKMALTKAGTGTLTLTGNNPYSGFTVVSGGKLILTNSGALPNSADIFVVGGTTFDPSGAGTFTLNSSQTLEASGTINGSVVAASGSSLTPGATNFYGTMTVTTNLTLNGGNVLNFELSSANTVGAGINDLIAVGGNLTLSGVSSLVIGGAPVAPGPYTLFTNTGSRVGGAANLSIVNRTRYSFSLNDSNPNKILLNVSGANDNLVWRGDGANNTWDALGLYNFTSGGSPAQFYQADAVLFDDTGSNTPSINLVGSIAPASVTVNAAQDYTFAGSGIVGPTALFKSGAGSLTLANTNNYGGGTFVTGGTLKVSSDVNLGVVPLAATPAQLVLDNGGAFQPTASLTLNANRGIALGPLTGSGSGVISVPGANTLTYGGIMASRGTGAGGFVTTGTGTLLLTGANTYTGASAANDGILQIGAGLSAGALGPGPISVNSPATLIHYRNDSPTITTPIAGNGPLVFRGTGTSGQSSYRLAGTNTFTGPVTLSLARIYDMFLAANFGNPSMITVPSGSSVYFTSGATVSVPLTLAGLGWVEAAGTLGALRLQSGSTWAGPITLSANARIGLWSGSLGNVTGPISGPYELELWGGTTASTVTIAPTVPSSFASLRLSSNIVVVAGSPGAFPVCPLTMNGGTLRLNGNNFNFTTFTSPLSGPIQNFHPTQPAQIAFSVDSAVTYGSAFSDGSTAPLIVTKNGAGTLTLTAASASFTGNLTNNGGGTITTSAGSGGLGSYTTLGRLIVANGGSTYGMTINNVFSNQGAAAQLLPTIILNGGSTLTTTRYNTVGNLVLNGGSTVTGNATDAGNYESYQLRGSVVVGGSGTSFITSGNGKAIHLGPNTEFNVADTTGDANPDLIISTPLRNQSGDFGLGAGALTKTGPGNLQLQSPNLYTGATSIKAGTLSLSGGGTLASGLITVDAGATLDASAMGSYYMAANQTLAGSGTVNGGVIDAAATTVSPGGNFAAGTLTLNNGLTLNGAGYGKLNIDLASSSTVGAGVNDLLIVNNGLTTYPGTVVNFNFLNGAPAAGPYTVVQYTGTRTGSAADLVATNTGRFVATFDESTPGQIRVTFTGSVSNLTWVGDGTANAWDSEVTTNWFDGTAISVFNPFDVVTFNDTTSNNVVNLTTAVSPGSITVNTATNYSLGGAGGKITGSTGLAKQGPGTLTLSSANDYVGVTTVAAGTLKTGNGAALGSTNGATLVQAGATLDVNAQNLGPEPVVINGTGVGGAGAVANSGAAQANALQLLTLGSDAAIGGGVTQTNRWDVRGLGSAVNLNGNKLTKTTSNYIAFVNSFVTNNGSIDINQGTLALAVDATVSGPGAITVNSNTFLSIGNWGAFLTLTKDITLNGGTLQSDAASASGNAMVQSSVLLATNSTINAQSSAILAFSNTISGAGSLLSVGGGTVYLLASNTYTGGTTVTNGTFYIGSNTVASSVVGPITNLAPAVVGYFRNDPFTLSNSIVGSGGLNLRTAGGMTVDSTAGINIGGGQIQVSRDYYAKLFVQPGGNIACGTFYLGNPANISADVVQLGGNVTSTNGVRIGHWANEVSTYFMGGGTLTVGGTEGLSVGWDGIGVFTLTNGTVNVVRMAVDGNGNTGIYAGTNETFNLLGGRINIGSGGITTASTDGGYALNLGGGTVGATASWSSALATLLTGLNGNTTLDSDVNTVTLSGALSGPGGLTKVGTGTLVLSGTSTYTGSTLVNNGVLTVSGNLTGGTPISVASGATVNLTGNLTGISPITVAAGGTLKGTGTNAGPVALSGVVAPGASVGKLTTGSETWNSGASLVFELNSASNSAAWDLLNVNGTIDVQATSAGKFVIKVVSMANGTTPGLLSDFSPTTSYVWTVATASGGVLNFNPAKFALDLSAFGNTYGGQFSVALQGNSIVVIYTYTAPPVIAASLLGDGNIKVTGVGVPGQGYSLLVATNLIPTVYWSPVMSTTADGATGAFTLFDLTATNYPERYYRVSTP